MADGAERAELTQLLEDAARAHRPDRARMLARVEQAMTTEPGAARRRPRDGGRGSAAPWMRVTAVATAVAGAVGLGGLAVGAVTGESDPTQTVVTSGGPGAGVPPPSPTAVESRAPAERSSGPSSARRTAGAPGNRLGGGRRSTAPAPSTATASTSTAPATSRTSGGGVGGVDGAPSPSDGVARPVPVSARGSIAAASNASWTQSDVVLTNSTALDSLSVELRVARTTGVTSTGSYTTASGATPSVTVQGAQLVYRWTLDAGNALAPGTHTFSGQFDHATGARDTRADAWIVRSDGPDGASSVGGGF